MFFKNNKNNKIEHDLEKVAELLIHDAKIDENKISRENSSLQNKIQQLKAVRIRILIFRQMEGLELTHDEF